MKNIDDRSPERSRSEVSVRPPPPPPPQPLASSNICKRNMTDQWIQRSQSLLPTATKDSWDRMFDEGYGCNVMIHTDGNGLLYAHANVLEASSDVIKGMIKQAKRKGHWRSISIRGVPREAVQIFIRFLYSSRYEKEDMEDFAMHLLVLSHVYVVPHLKKLCEWHYEKGLLAKDNVIDVFQLALLCDTPRLGFLCHRIILKNLEEVSTSEGWQAMKESHPRLEKELSRSVAYEQNRQKQRIRKQKERKIYTQLYETMEAFVHICREGCRTIGPKNKDINEGKEQCCGYSAACKGLEMLLRHFAGCKLRVVPGGCSHCKRMWQLLELHSRLCVDSEQCKVPLCGNFKERMKKQSKKDERRWKLLVKNVLSAKRIGGSPFFLQTTEVVFMI
ncbi:PREDICTED: BTB/POZ and TAZ domain-containing protein 5 [Tarenaya hassleriana]|uniref:BTB/POZ and TAZ domain-containing protein 5 n=1 Tax=Tarenaya hassleriana TaxID=28532 RepID=UPI00053C5DA4|nr:PREDICTED: BTB/POZ and TAZ domain-containing protein 5 [Tarenaya hassleriana]